MQLHRVLAGLVLGATAMTATPRTADAEPPGPANGSTTADRVGFEVGDRFPEVVLPSLADGTPLSIASFRGRKLVLHVWASW